MSGLFRFQNSFMLVLLIMPTLSGCVDNDAISDAIVYSENTIEPTIPSTEVSIFVSSDVGEGEGNPIIVSPYVPVKIQDIEIRYLKVTPVQVELIIHGTLPDQCTYDLYSVENRGNLEVRIDIKGIHPSNRNCLQTEQTIEYVLLLGRDMPEKERGFVQGEYTLVVNDFITAFSIK